MFLRLILYLVRTAIAALTFIFYTIKSSISFAKVMITPPARVKKPFARCDGSCDFRDKPTCTIPKPRIIKPIARIKPKIKVERLLITESGSPAAKAVMLKQKRQSTIAINAAMTLPFFLPFL